MSHLKEINDTYFNHMARSMRYSFLLLLGSCGALAHAFIPALLKHSTTNIVNAINEDLKT